MTSQLTPAASRTVDELAQRYGLGRDAVLHMLDALQRGGGTMAQFNHPELGGNGQWMRGGMTMVGDMFNNQLKATVDGLCQELANLLASQPFEHTASDGAPASSGLSGAWWPVDLGSPASSGAQNNIRYAYFPGPRRLAVEMNGALHLYDTGDHQIQGVSQQQGGSSTLSFSSQRGSVSLADLVEVGKAPATPNPMPGAAAPSPQGTGPAPVGGSGVGESAVPGDQASILAALEKLGELHDRGILSEAEFSAKKAELLKRL